MVTMQGAPREFDFLHHPGGRRRIRHHLGNPRAVVLRPLLTPLAHRPRESHRGVL